MNPLEQYKNRNIFLTGVAGTGKTYLINEYVADHKGTTLLCASTGTAAVNIGGVTAHRLFSIPVPAYGADPNKIPPSKLSVFQNIDTVIIDEISMMRNDAFSFAMRVKKRAEEIFGKKIRLIVSGDFSQLPPIVKKSEENYFTRYGFDHSGYCFTAKEWAECRFKTIELTEIKRQEDKEFVENLTKARIGDASCIPYFNQFVGRELPDDAIRICGTNAEADKINQEYLNAIEKPLTAFQAEKIGITGKEMPCDEILLLKEGCRVMFIANDSPLDADGGYNLGFGNTGRFTNGTFGVVTGIGQNTVSVRTEAGEDIEVERHKWTVYNYRMDKATKILEKTEIGSIKQIPLKIAKAITIHKSQGKTFDKMVLSPQIFAFGQLYVALSRAKGPEGLFLTEPILPEYLKTDKKVQAFIGNGYEYTISDAQIRKQKETESAQKKAKKAKETKRAKRTVKLTATTRIKSGTKTRTKIVQKKKGSSVKKKSSAAKKPAVKKQNKTTNRTVGKRRGG